MLISYSNNKVEIEPDSNNNIVMSKSSVLIKNKDKVQIMYNYNSQLYEFNIDQIRTKGKKI